MIALLLLSFSIMSTAPAENVKASIVEELSLGGADAGEWAQFTNTASLSVDGEGRLFVLDSGNFRIVVLEKDGSFSRFFGRAGQGPGEFNEPVAMAFDPDGNLAIFDTGTHKLIVLDVEGNFVRESRFASQIHGVFFPVFLKNGHVAFTAYRLDDQLQLTYDLSQYDPNMDPVRRIHHLPTPKLDWSQMQQPSFWVGFLKDQFEVHAKGFPLAAAAGGSLLTARTHQYRVVRHGEAGDAETEWRGESKPKLASEEAKRAYCEGIWQNLAANPNLAPALTNAVFERAVAETSAWEVLPPITALCAFRDGFAVLADYDILQKDGRLDFYDQGGSLLGAAPYQGNLLYLTGKGARLYAVSLDEDDYIVIKRFRVVGI